MNSSSSGSSIGQSGLARDSVFVTGGHFQIIQ